MAAKKRVAQELLALVAQGPVELTNDQLAELWGVTSKSVRECVVRLEGLGVIEADYFRPTGAARQSNRVITRAAVIR